MDPAAQNQLTLLSRLLDGESLNVAEMPYKTMNCTARSTDRKHCPPLSAEGMEALMQEARRRRGY